MLTAKLARKLKLDSLTLNHCHIGDIKTKLEQLTFHNWILQKTMALQFRLGCLETMNASKD